MSYSVFDEEPQQQQKPTNSNQGFILGLLIIGLLSFFAASHFGWISPPDREVNPTVVIDDQPTVEPDKEKQISPKIDKPKLNETYIVRVYESKRNEDWFSDQVRNDKFWLVKLPKMGVKLEYVDPFSDDGEMNPQAKSFVKAAKDRNIDPKKPYWIHAHRGKVLSITPFSKDVGPEQWEQIIRNSCKD